MSDDLIHALQHHAKDKWDIAAMIALVFATKLNPRGWQVKHAGVGGNSWRMYHPETGQVWFFTGYTKGVVHARDDYYWAKASRHHSMKTRGNVIAFARHVLKATP